MRTVAIVQARTTSERFPMKIFAGIGGRPMLSHVLERAAAIKGIDQVVLAVPENDVKLVSHLWPHVYGGSEKDVLSRYAGAAEWCEANVIIRVTGDTPLLAPDLISWGLHKYITESRFGYFPLCQPYEKVADGWDGEIFTNYEIQQASKSANKDQREHVTTFFRDRMSCYSPCMFLDETEDYTPLKCSVDTREDIERVNKIYDHLEDKKDFSHMATWQAWERAGKP